MGASAARTTSETVSLKAAVVASRPCARKLAYAAFGGMEVRPGATVAPVIVVSPLKTGNQELLFELHGSAGQYLDAGSGDALVFTIGVF